MQALLETGDQVSGQLDAGFVISELCKDRYDPVDKDMISDYLATCIAIRACRPKTTNN